MTFDKAYKKILEIFPKAECTADGIGEVTIYTGCQLDANDELIDLPEK